MTHETRFAKAADGKYLVAGSGLEFVDVGEHELKGIPGDWHLYRATAS